MQYRYEIIAVQPSGSILFVVIFRIGIHSTQLFIILFKGGQVLSGLCKLSLLHALTHVPVHERTLRIHEVELVVEARPGLSDGGGVAQHAHGSLDFCQVTTGNCSWRLVVDANLLRQRRQSDR